MHRSNKEHRSCKLSTYSDKKNRTLQSNSPDAENTANQNKKVVPTTKSEILSFLSETLHINVPSIESLGSGHVYAQLLDILHGGFPMHLLGDNTSSERVRYNNLKIVQGYLAKRDMNINFPIDKIAKCSMQYNLEVIQWLVKYYVVQRDEGRIMSRISVNDHADSKKDHAVSTNAGTGNIVQKNENVNLEEINEFITKLEEERDFYYYKLLEIERTINVDRTGERGIVRKIKAILENKR